MPSKPPGPWMLVGLGSALVAMVIGGMSVGWLIDTRVHLFPLLTLIGLAGGITAASWYLFSLFRQSKRD